MICMNGSRKENSNRRFVCIDLEMTKFSPRQRNCVPGANGEVIQFGAVMLDERYNMISKFSSYVKPSYSSVTPPIATLTGITNRALENADDFITVFDKFCYWRGDADVTTFCWSTVDYNQLWAELQAKGRHRQDLSFALKDFVDMQKIFGKLIGSKTLVGLEAALKLLQMEYEGQIHTAYCDSYNTARIVHKLFCTEALDVELEFLNPNSEKSVEERSNDEYGCSLASFLPPELLAQFGYEHTPEAEDEAPACLSYDGDEFEVPPERPEIFDVASLDIIGNKEEMLTLCAKYRIEPSSWVKLAREVEGTREMQVA
ncbi:MAG: exonuclease domain-containing protein [Treponema sp.]|nr:exonuclease domain-containing protein [Treponema sp.]